MQFGSAYQNYLLYAPNEKPNVNGDNHPHFTNYTPTFTGMLDYIFYNLHSKLQPKSLLQLPQMPELDYAQGIPNIHHPSDHLPIMAEFIIKP